MNWRSNDPLCALERDKTGTERAKPCEVPGKLLLKASGWMSGWLAACGEIVNVVGLNNPKFNSSTLITAT